MEKENEIYYLGIKFKSGIAVYNRLRCGRCRVRDCSGLPLLPTLSGLT